MSEQKATRTVVVTDPAGVHARTAVAIAEVVRKIPLKSDIEQRLPPSRRQPMFYKSFPWWRRADRRF